MSYMLTLPTIEQRFLPPKNWRVDSFHSQHREIFYRTAFIDAPKDIVYILPGLSEFGEKYIETTRDLNAKGFDVVVIDWAYQGLSHRYSSNRHKRSSDGITLDVMDLHTLITSQINAPLPHLMLAHSMGGNIGLRYLEKYPARFKAASFSAPMLGIAGICTFTKLTRLLLKLLTPFKNSYVPGGHDWSALDRHDILNNVFSHDKLRCEVHNAWMAANPDLQVGNATYRWLDHSLRSISFLAKQKTLRSIHTPLVLGLAEKDTVVDNKAIIHAAAFLPNAHLEFLNGSGHEILMEGDEIRDRFMDETLKLFGNNL